MNRPSAADCLFVYFFRSPSILRGRLNFQGAALETAISVSDPPYQRNSLFAITTPLFSSPFRQVIGSTVIEHDGQHKHPLLPLVPVFTFPVHNAITLHRSYSTTIAPPRDHTSFPSPDMRRSPRTSLHTSSRTLRKFLPLSGVHRFPHYTSLLPILGVYHKG